MGLGDFPCKTRANTGEFRQGYERSFPTGMKKSFCPFCSKAVSKEDNKCRYCHKELTSAILQTL